MQMTKPEPKEEDARFAIKGVNGRIVTAPLNELWKESPRREARI